ncbi:MAG: hypothetical protein WCT14_00930 [Treponemataceae bacterium]
MSIKSLRGLLFALALGACTAAVWADVVFLRDGRILIGTIAGTIDGGVTYKVAGETVSVDVNNIVRTERELSALASMPIEVVLKDSSVIRGKIADYDEELGLFVDISFGTLTIPLATIAEVVDPQRRTKYSGAAFQVRAAGGVYSPVLSGADTFGPSWTAQLGASWSLPFMRGLSGGLTVSYSGADYKKGGVNYAFLSVRPEISYRYLAFRLKDGFSSRFTPIVSLSAGPAYIDVNDSSSTPSRYGQLAAEIGLSAGVELSIAAGISARIEAFVDAYTQKSGPFVTAGALISISYEQ